MQFLIGLIIGNIIGLITMCIFITGKESEK